MFKGLSQVEAAAIAELAERKRMAIRLFRPQPHQDEIFKNPAKYTLVEGGNRCLSADSEVLVLSEYGPVPSEIKDIEVGDKIHAMRKGGKRKDLCWTKVTDKWEFQEEAYRLTTKRGYILDGVHDHPVYACPPTEPNKKFNNSVMEDDNKAQWMILSEVPTGWYVRMAFGPHVDWEGDVDEEAYLQGVMEGDGSFKTYDYGVMKLAGHRNESIIPWVQKKLSESGVKSRAFEKDGNGVSLEWCNLPYKRSFSEWKPKWTAEEIAGYIRGLMDTDGCVSKEGKVIFVQNNEETARDMHRWLLLFGIKSSLYFIEAKPHQKRPNGSWRLVISGCSVRRYAKSIGFNETEKARKLEIVASERRAPGPKKQWWDRIRSVEKIGKKDIVAISTETQTYISNGIVSHNSGKSLNTFVLTAGVAMDEKVTLSDGTVVDCRLQHQKGRPVRIWICCIDWKHVGRAIYPMLFKSGAFQVCIDPETKILRAYRGDEDKDKGIKPKPAPPLIPKRYIESISWENKAEDIFSRVMLKNPRTGEHIAEICAYTSKSDPPQGVPVDHISVDEQLANAGFAAELRARLVDRDGRMFWASWPDQSSEELEEFVDVLDREIEKGNTNVAKRVRLTMSGNKVLGKKAIESFLAGCATEEERLARDQGLFLGDRVRMYPMFDRVLHSVNHYNDDLAKKLEVNDGIPPNDWTKYLVLDPGTSHPYVLLGAVPPPELGDFLVCYQEFYPGRMSPRQLAAYVAKRTKGERFYKFLIDKRAGRQQSMGLETSVAAKYAEVFGAEGMRCQLTNNKFVYASDNVGARQVMVSDILNATSKGPPKLRIVTNRCPVLCDQLKKVKKKEIKKEVDEERKAGGASDAVDCLEYLVASKPRFVELPPDPNISPAFVRYMRRFGNRNRQQEQTIAIGTRY